MDSILPTSVTAGIGAAIGLGLGAGSFAYASLWPASKIFGRALIAPRQPDELALTFDDGPNAAWTPRLLDILAGHGVHATLFMMGSHAQLEKGLVRRAHAEGHLIGIHSWSHPNLARSSKARIRRELTQSRDEIQQIVGAPVRFFRPPFGARRPAVFAIARSLDLNTVLWNAMTSDWAEQSTGKIVARLTAKIDRLNRHGRAANIVLHDGGHLDPAVYREPSVLAADRLVAHYKPTHRFVTLDAWA
jgi:peptidoglycan/xylan/chitin deacetylase (PgdA/CDA1 family)